MTRAAFAAGAPAPEVLDEVTVDGRFGIVLSRLDGPTLRHLSQTGAMTSPQVGAILATLAVIRPQDAPTAGGPCSCAIGWAIRCRAPLTGFRSTSPPASSP